MGERSDNFLHAFDGWTLDWNAVFGLGFDTAPKDWVTVYRECSLDELARVAREGLTVPSAEMRHPDTRQESEFLDRFRPQHIVKNGISRLKAIYAVPTPDTPRLHFRRERAVIEMKVDPSAGFVGDMDFVTALIPFLGTRGSGAERYHGAFRRYWESVIPLKSFYRHYGQIETDDGLHWVKRRGAPARLPRSFFSPEIMLMTPVVSKQHLRIIRWEPGSEEHAVREWWNDSEEVWGEM
ncbi:hypothetical protein ACFL26_02195 [Patescibacteria group bacterium]